MKPQFFFSCMFLRRGQEQLGLSLCLIRHGETMPAQTWTGPEVSMRSRLPDFKKNRT